MTVSKHDFETIDESEVNGDFTVDGRKVQKFQSFQRFLNHTFVDWAIRAICQQQKFDVSEGNVEESQHRRGLKDNIISG